MINFWYLLLHQPQTSSHLCLHFLVDPRFSTEMASTEPCLTPTDESDVIDRKVCMNVLPEMQPPHFHHEQ